MYFVCAQTANMYYCWQVAIMLHNFIKVGIDPGAIHVVCDSPVAVPAEWRALVCTYPQVNFFFYDDTRKRKAYPPSIRPHLLKKHFAAHAYLQTSPVFYCDCDIVFTRKIAWDEFLKDDIWYVSDTRSYIGAAYIKGKGDDVYKRMCDIVGISTSTPEENEEHSGGAQYILKGASVAFWDKVERDCEDLYSTMLTQQQQTTPENSIQAWTADMWAVLWNAWYFGHVVRIHPTLEFAWPFDPAPRWNQCAIYHNAGVSPKDRATFFYKGDFTDGMPMGMTHNMYPPGSCSSLYVDEIIEVTRSIESLKNNAQISCNRTINNGDRFKESEHN